MIAQTDERRMGIESRQVPLGPLQDVFICLGMLMMLVIVPAIVATLIVTIGDFVLQYIELPKFFVFWS